MARFRKKPVVVEAVQFLPHLRMDDLLAFSARAAGWRLTPDGIEVPTLEGTLLARPGDSIVRGVKGEYYPCTPDVFDLTYEPCD